MEERSQAEEQKIRLYIAYEKNLYAEQLAKILSSLERLYNYLYISHAPELSLPLPLETQMRVDECRTGHSIEILLSEGIRQIINASGPFIQVLAPTGIIGAMIHLLFGYAKSYAEIRKTWYEVEQERYKAEQAKYEAQRLKREIEREETEMKLQQSHFDLSGVSTERKQQASEAIADFFYVLEGAPNIIRVRVNDVVILDNQPETQSPQSKQTQ